MLIRGTALTLIMLAIFQVGCRPKPTPQSVAGTDDSKTSHVEESMPIEETVPDKQVTSQPSTETEENFVQLKFEHSFNTDWQNEFKAKYPDSPLVAEYQISEKQLNIDNFGIPSYVERHDIGLPLTALVNEDSLAEYLKLRFPNHPKALLIDVRNINRDIDHTRFKTLKQIDELMNSTEEMRFIIRLQLCSLEKSYALRPASTQLIWAIGCVDEQFRDQPHWDVLHETKKVIEELIADQ